MASSEIQKLYVIERQIADKPPDEKQAIRQGRADTRKNAILIR
jgi:hypothetical protein